MRDIYLSSNLNPLTQFTSCSRSTKFKDIRPFEHLSNGQEDHPNQLKNCHKPSSVTRHPLLSLIESQLKLRQQNNQNFPMVGNPL